MTRSIEDWLLDPHPTEPLRCRCSGRMPAGPRAIDGIRAKYPTVYCLRRQVGEHGMCSACIRAYSRRLPLILDTDKLTPDEQLTIWRGDWTHLAAHYMEPMQQQFEQLSDTWQAVSDSMTRYMLPSDIPGQP